MSTRRWMLLTLVLVAVTALTGVWAVTAFSGVVAAPKKNSKAATGPDLPLVSQVEHQPLAAHARRVMQALQLLGEPLSAKARARLQTAVMDENAERGIRAIQEVLDPRCLVGVNINPESRVKVRRGPAAASLMAKGWRVFLVKVENEAGVTAPLDPQSPNARRLHGSPKEEVPSRWLELVDFRKQPLNARLSGLELEYRILTIYSRDSGKREAKLSFDVGQGTQDLGFRNEVDILFTCEKPVPVTLRVLDDGGKPTMGKFIIRDRLGRIYPSRAKRLAPDFAFHPQIYRSHGEKVYLPPGEYVFEYSRGPEYLVLTKTVRVPKSAAYKETFQLKRWVDPAKRGWYSGDHHIHAAGCAHYNDPSLGVHPPDMLRHCQGEDLKVGCNLTWGPCFDYQKQFFTGLIDKVSKYPYLLRYDIEVSGFGSHRSGHLCLLRLKDQIYPGGDSKDHWPTLGLSTLKWARKQGAVVGPAHSGWGLVTPETELPNYVIPPFNGIGANEYIVDVTHMTPGPTGAMVPLVDFMSTVDTPYPAELNIWYQTLNCGYRTRISGETDFPCIYGERVGLGRSYVKVDGKLNFDDWVEGIREGRNYVSDGFSHLMDFKAESVAVGEKGSELKLAKAGKIKLTVRVAARLDEKPNEFIRGRNPFQKPFWHLERARLGNTREVPVEVLVNGYPVAKQTIVADGKARNVSFEVDIAHSSWVALRILASSHTNPIFVLVDGKPIRPSRRSAEWCLKSVDQCWSQKQRFYKAEEMPAARAAYEHARREYRRILAESVAE